MTEYVDTRGLVDRPRTFTEVLLDGIAPGGGLYVPKVLPAVTPPDFLRFATQPYHERAAHIYEAFGLDVPPDVTADIAAQAYGANFDDPAVAPVRDLGDGRFVLELWHGPTLAFKDMALQCMPLFFSQALEQAHLAGATDLDFLVLVATSGDTGDAALNGFADRAHTRIVVYYPDAGVSAIQERQMMTQPGDNVSVFGVAGDFDACQSTVKAVFDDAAFADELAHSFGFATSSANSINWGRLMPQIVYYVSAYADLVAGGHVATGGPIDVCVPTGNFGNILAGYYAKLMGVPIRRHALREQHQQRARRLHRHRCLRHLGAAAGEDAVTLDGHPHLVQPGTAALRPLRRREAHPAVDGRPRRAAALRGRRSRRGRSCRPSSPARGSTTTPACARSGGCSARRAT